MNERVVCGLANKCGEASCPHRLPHDRKALCAIKCKTDWENESACIDFVEYLTGIRLKGGKNIEPCNGGLPVKIFRKEVNKVAKFRKKPVVIEATAWDGTFEHAEKLGATRYPFITSHKHCDNCGQEHRHHAWIETLEGGLMVCSGDFIITGIKGEKYPCKPDIFEKTYEPVKD